MGPAEGARVDGVVLGRAWGVRVFVRWWSGVLRLAAGSFMRVVVVCGRMHGERYGARRPCPACQEEGGRRTVVR